MARVPHDEPTRRMPPAEVSEPILRSGGSARVAEEPTDLFQEPPRRIERFTVLERIGSGGVGVVYSAYDPRLDRRVALKLLKPMAGGGTGDDDLRARFVREGQAMARLQHPNVLTVYDVGVVDDEVFLVLELVEGQSLRAHLAATNPSWREVVALYVAAGRGLAAAHAVGLVHRDFKPGNVLVGNDGRVRVMDFGIAQMTGARPSSDLNIDEAEPFETAPGTAMGTPAYMAPEQHAGELVDARADQFAFSISLYEGLFGQRPFAWKDGTELRAAVLAGEVRPPPSDSPVPGWVRRIVLRGLERDPTRRWPSIQAMLQALGRDPRRRWNRLAAGVAMVAALGAGFFYSQHRSEAARCDGGIARLSGVWDDARKEDLSQRFAAVDSELGPRVWERVEARLDAYTGQWSERHREVCEATEVDGAQSREVMHLRMFCLERQAFALEGFTAALADPTRLTMLRAIEGVGDLQPVGECPREAFDAQLEFAPDDATLERITGLRARLAEAAGRQSAGDYDGGVQLAREVLAEARSMGYRAFQAEAQLRLGSLLHYAGEYDASARMLTEASFGADETRMDHVAAEAKTLAAHVVSRHLAKYDDGELWAGHARAAILRTRPLDEALLARLMVYRGAMKKDEGEYPAAIEELTRALEVRKRVLGEGAAEVGYVHGELGGAYMRMEDYASAQTHYARALEIHRAILGDGHPELAADLNNLGEVALARGELAVAREHFTRSIELYELMKEDIYPDAGVVYGNLGDVLARSGKYERARTAHERALQILADAHGAGHPEEASVRLGMARAALARGNPDEARAQAEQALAIWRATFGEDHPRVAEARAFLSEPAP